MYETVPVLLNLVIIGKNTCISGTSKCHRNDKSAADLNCVTCLRILNPDFLD
jgi:hypothetical protein